MSSHRHCMVVHAYYPVGETRVQREAVALVDHGVDVDVLCLRAPGEPRREIVDGVDVHRLPVRRHRGRGILAQLLEYSAFFVVAGIALSGRHLTRRYRTVQVHNLPDFLVFCALVPKLTGARVILDIHDLMPEFLASKTERDIDDPLVRIIRFQERLACGFADQVITVTTEWRRILGARAAPIEKISVVMNLADQRMFASSPRDRSRGDDGLRVLYHGTFTHRYGLDLLIRAVDAVADEVPGIRLDLMGDGDSRESLVALVRALGLDGRVEFSDGMLDAAWLPVMLRSADVGVVPHRSDLFTDGLLPTKLLEYVAVGTPVIASRTPGVAAYFDNSMVSFFEPGNCESLADCLRGLHRDRNRLNEYSAAAATFNDRHNWQSASREYVHLVGGVGRHG